METHGQFVDVLVVLADGAGHRDQNQANRLRGRFADTWDRLKRIGNIVKSRSHASSRNARHNTGKISYLANGRRRESDAYLGRPCFPFVLQRGRPMHSGWKSVSSSENRSVQRWRHDL